jgi:hypothetical protein
VWHTLAEGDAISAEAKPVFRAQKRFYRIKVTKLPAHYWSSIREVKFKK